jgi:hypothetical protein
MLTEPRHDVAASCGDLCFAGGDGKGGVNEQTNNNNNKTQGAEVPEVREHAVLEDKVPLFEALHVVDPLGEVADLADRRQRRGGHGFFVLIDFLGWFDSICVDYCTR